MAKKEEKNIKDKTSFVKSFKAELKKVIWPTPKQLFNNTVAVLAIVIISAAIVFVLDFAFESMNKYGFDKIKQSVIDSSTTNTEEETTDSEDETVDTEETVDSEDESVDTEETENTETVSEDSSTDENVNE